MSKNRRVVTDPSVSPVSSTPAATSTPASEPVMTQGTSSVLTIDLNNPEQVAALRAALGIKAPKAAATAKAKAPREAKPWIPQGSFFLFIPDGFAGEVTAQAAPPSAVFEVERYGSQGKYVGYYIARTDWKRTKTNSAWYCSYKAASEDDLRAAGYPEETIAKVLEERALAASRVA